MKFEEFEKILNNLWDKKASKYAKEQKQKPTIINSQLHLVCVCYDIFLWTFPYKASKNDFEQFIINLIKKINKKVKNGKINI